MNNYPEEFSIMYVDCQRKYDSKLEKYGESWRKMTIRELIDRLVKEFDELMEIQRPISDKEKEEFYEELLDIINCSMMLGVKLMKDEDNKL